MQLKLICPICQKKYDKSLEHVKSQITDSALQNAAIGVLTPPKQVVIISENRIGSQSLLKYSCNHIVLNSHVEAEKLTGYNSLSKGFKSFDFQTEGVNFGIESNFNLLIADEMGLGKTIQAAILARLAVISNLFPIVLIVKSATIYQWIKENHEWFSQDNDSVCPIMTSKDFVFPGFKLYILSMDLLPSVVDKLISIKPKLVIADEVQCFKNAKSSRSKALVKLVQEGKVEHKIFLSGTPIKNRASEYFTILNLLAPGLFPSFKKFCIQWLQPNDKGVYDRIRPRLLDAFRDATKNFIIRRECADVQKDLPPCRQDYREIVIEDPNFKDLYNQELDLFTNWYNDTANKKDSIAILGWLAKLRHTIGIAKVPYAVEYAKEFLDQSENEKIAIGIHHKTVRDELFYHLEPYGCVKLSGEDSAAEKDLIVNAFNGPDKRVLVVNEVSGGTGLDGLQKNCNNVICLERQWTWADERQFEKRFDRTGQTKPVLVTYLMAHGTIDTFLDAKVRMKQAISQETFGIDYNIANDNTGLRELSEQLIAGGHLY